MTDINNKYGPVCWICEKRIEGGVFSPFVETTIGRASACEKHATHKWILENGFIKDVKIL